MARHLGVQEILVDGRQLFLQSFVQRGDNLGIALHDRSFGDIGPKSQAQLRPVATRRNFRTFPVDTELQMGF